MSDIVERARNRNMPFGHLELIDKLADEIERLQVYKVAADAYLAGLNDHLHGENLRADLVALRANWDAARRALEGK